MTSWEETALVALAPIVVTALLFVLILRWVRPRQRRWLAGTGAEEWRQVAKELPVRQRFSIARANVRGRRAPSGWEDLAAQRARMALATGERMQGPGWRRFRHLLVAGYAVLLVAGFLQLATLGWGLWYAWVEVVGFAVCLAGWSTWSRTQRRQMALVARSLAMNTRAAGT